MCAWGWVGDGGEIALTRTEGNKCQTELQGYVGSKMQILEFCNPTFSQQKNITNIYFILQLPAF